MIFAPGLLAGRVAIVTGAGTGIGRGIALELARAGASVVLAGRRPEPLKGTRAEVEALGASAIAVPTNIRDWEAANALGRAAVDAYGRIDILVNNAGGQFGAPFEQLSPKGWSAVVETNLGGVFNCTRAAGDVMLRQQSGKVVNIITGFTRRAAPFLSHSGAARAGVENLTRSLALEWAAHNIQVNCISPVVNTEAFQQNQQRGPNGEDTFLPNVPAGRYGSGQEVGWLVVYLCSPAGDYITGEHIALDGGYWLGSAVAMRTRSGAMA